MLGNRRIWVLLTSLMVLTSVEAVGQESGSRRGGGNDLKEEGGGIIPLVRNERERDQWREIEALILKDDDEGRPAHPTLRRLWQWLNESGHTIYVDIRKRRGAMNVAGSFTFKKYDPKGLRHIGLIRLNLSNIDLATVTDRNRLRNGLIPFDGLGKVERYAEVLGHEMSHAVHILDDPELGGSVLNLIIRTNEMLLDRNRARKLHEIGPELRSRLSERDKLLKMLESHAGDMEKIVWQELHDGPHEKQPDSPATQIGKK